ncbi:MAG TPA: transcriptional repressor LexA [Anaerolineae bacterium]|nr:transcriptional repressor LexA [Anaerolineae bacterium]
MNLSARQQAIVEFIQRFTQAHQYPPTIREIGQEVGITSTSVVNYNLNILEREGLIERDKEVSRGIKLIGAAAQAINLRALVSVPLLGRIAAGEPIPVPSSDFAVMPEETIELTRGLLPADTKDIYALQVRGASMIDAMIGDGDIVVMKHQQTAKNGELVAVWLRDKEETTLKRFFLENGRIRLQPENPTMKPIYADPKNVEVQGKVVLVLRRPE